MYYYNGLQFLIHIFCLGADHAVIPPKGYVLLRAREAARDTDGRTDGHLEWGKKIFF